MQEIPEAWKAVQIKYGSKAIFIEGDYIQPNYRFNLDFNYHLTEGHLSFSWRHTKNTYEQQQKFKWHAIDDPRRQIGNIYDTQTVLLMELPVQKNRLKIFTTGPLMNLLNWLYPGKISTGHANFDETFITIAKPASIVPSLMPYLGFLLHPSLGRSLSLNISWQDAETALFYLRLKINQLITDEQDLEFILANTFKLTNQLSRC
ncbi:hypothetical protein AB6805_06820 [Chitinophaga sp. RCC_12]|uniref:hypothetical protein n=1 Tax=Chitinophaga sp. RCC_12 TaxID=3239226 RepID=UPI00352473FA